MTRVAFLATIVVGLGLAAPAAADEPQSTTATYGTWQLRCQTSTVDGKPVKNCEIAQTIQIQGQSQPLVQIAIGPQATGAPLKLVLLTPIGVWLPEPPAIVLDDSGADITTVFRRCLPSTCFSDVPFTDAIKARFTAKGDTQGAVVFHPDEGKDAKIPISFKGFSGALEALTAALPSK